MATVQDKQTYWYQCDQIGAPLELTDQQFIRATALAEAHMAWYQVAGGNAKRSAGDILAIIVEAGLIEQEAKWSTTLRDIEAGGIRRKDTEVDHAANG